MALFVSNPRRRRRRNALALRRNALALKPNGALNVLIAQHLSKKRGRKVRANDQATIRAFKKSKGYKKWLADNAEEFAGRKTARKARYKKKDSKGRSPASAHVAAKAKDRKGSARKKGKSKTVGKDGKTYYFIDGNRVSAAKYKKSKRKTARNPRRRNALALKRNGTKKGMVRKTARRAYMKNRGLTLAQKRAGFGGKAAQRAAMKKNPLALFKNPRRRRNALALKTNPSRVGGFGLIDTASSLVSRVPVIGGPLAEQLAPVFFGAVSAYGVIQVHSLVERYTGFYSRFNLQPFSYTLAGVTGSIATLAVASMLPANLRTPAHMAAAAMSTLGAGFDIYRYFQGQSAAASLDGMGALAVTGASLNGMHLNGAHRAVNSNPMLLQAPGQGGLAMDFGAMGAEGAHGAHGAEGAYGALIYSGGTL